MGERSGQRRGADPEGRIEEEDIVVSPEGLEGAATCCDNNTEEERSVTRLANLVIWITILCLTVLLISKLHRKYHIKLQNINQLSYKADMEF